MFGFLIRLIDPTARPTEFQLGLGSRSLDDRADPPVVLVDQEDRRAMARPAFGRVVGPE